LGRAAGVGYGGKDLSLLFLKAKNKIQGLAGKLRRLAMKSKSFIKSSSGYRGGYILLIMILLVIVLGAAVWFNPTGFFDKGGKEHPWNQLGRIVPKGKDVPQPKEGQVKIATNMMLTAKCDEDGQERGQVAVGIGPDGRVQGMWGADYYPKKDLRYEVVMGRFEGNIDPKYVYKDDLGKDPSKLHIITKGPFMIMETKEESGRMRTVKGRLYVIGWISPDYMLEGKVTITSDNKNYFEYGFRGQLEEGILIMPAGPIGLPGLIPK
jgi:hypothetical protein